VAERGFDTDAMKRAAAYAALEFVTEGSVIGVGSGTTTWAFVDALAEQGPQVRGVIAASAETEMRLAEAGLRVLTPDAVLHLPLLVDGADEVDAFGRALKGGGGAHVREKVLATWAGRWVCVVDETKVVEELGARTVAVEVVPFALATVTRALVALGGVSRLREGSCSDNGNPVLDVAGLDLSDPLAAEEALDAIPGVVGNGIFARRRADVVLVGRSDGEVARLTPAAPDA